ncbi:major facilitator superfamily domain-containing protein [Mycena olivaceomarginata]|nr:major facilitator superfamily domain-containing protein [Mycena olivaceomarginata]
MTADNQNTIAPNTSILPIATPAPPDVEMRPIRPQLDIKDKHDEDPYLIAFIHPVDPSNPQDWPHSRKCVVTDVLSATGFCRIMVSTIMAPALPTIKAQLHMNSTEAAMALSIHLLATAFGPLVIGPLSEIYGRKNILHACNAWFLVWNFVCGFAGTKELLIAARFLAGFGASSMYALGGGVLGDVWQPEKRGRSLRMYSLIQLLGAAVGPIIGGIITAIDAPLALFVLTFSLQQPEPGNLANNNLSGILVFDSTID